MKNLPPDTDLKGVARPKMVRGAAEEIDPSSPRISHAGDDNGSQSRHCTYRWGDEIMKRSNRNAPPSPKDGVRTQVSRRRFLQGGAAAVAASASAGVFSPRRSAAADELAVLTWCSHADSRLIGSFEEAHGVRVNVKTYEGTGSALSIKDQSLPGEWDIFVCDAQDTPRVAREGYIMELSRDIVDWDTIWPELREMPYTWIDGKFYAVPDKFGYLGVAYNKETVDPADARTAEVMWNPKYKGRTGVFDYYMPVVQLIGISLGLRPVDITVENLRADIRPLLLALKEQSTMVGDIPTFQTALVTNTVDLVVGTAEFGVAHLMVEHPHLDWTIFDEGGLLWNESLTIFADSKRKDLALEFIKHCMSLEGSKYLATSECYWSAVCNKDIELTEEEKKILRWDDQPDFLSRSYPSAIGEPELDTAMLDLWNEFLQA